MHALGPMPVTTFRRDFVSSPLGNSHCEAFWTSSCHSSEDEVSLEYFSLWKPTGFLACLIFLEKFSFLGLDCVCMMTFGFGHFTSSVLVLQLCALITLPLVGSQMLSHPFLLLSNSSNL